MLLASEPYKETFAYVREAGLPEADVDQILNRNATVLFGLERSAG